MSESPVDVGQLMGCAQIRAAKTMSRIWWSIWVVCVSLKVRLWTNPSGTLPGPAHPVTALVVYVCVTLT
jgi:hypothetical protein